MDLYTYPTIEIFNVIYTYKSNLNAAIFLLVCVEVCDIICISIESRKHQHYNNIKRHEIFIVATNHLATSKNENNGHFCSRSIQLPLSDITRTNQLRISTVSCAPN